MKTLATLGIIGATAGLVLSGVRGNYIAALWAANCIVLWSVILVREAEAALLRGRD